MADSEDTQQADIADAPRKRRLWRVMAGIIAGIAMLLAAALALLDSSIGHRFVANQIASLAPASGLRIQVSRIEGSLYGTATLHDLVLSDPQGEFARVPEAELDWRPLSWFSSGLDVRTLALHRGRLKRFPELLPGDPDAPILPNFDIRVDRLEVDRLTLEEPVLGETRTVDFLAQAMITDGRAQLEAKGNLGGEDRLALKLDSRPDDDQFDVDLDYAAPKGGFLAGLTGANDDLTIRVLGDGSWSEWDGALLVRQQGKRLVALKLSNRAGSYSALGQVDAGPYLPAALEPLVGGRMALSLSSTLEDSVADGTMALIGKGIRLTGRGAVDFAGNSFDDFSLRAVLTDPRAFGPAIRLENARLTAQLDGQFRNLTVRHLLSAGELEVSGTRLAKLTQEGVLTYSDGVLTIPLDVRTQRVVTGLAMADPRLVNGRLNGTMTLDGSRLSAERLQLRFPGLRARVALRGDIDRGRYAVSGPVEFDDLALDSVGAASGVAEIDFGLASNGQWTLATDLRAALPEPENATIANLAGEEITVSGHIEMGADQPIIFEDTRLAGSKLSLAVDGMRDPDGRTFVGGMGNHTTYGDFSFTAEMTGEGPQAQVLLDNPVPAAGLRNVQVLLQPDGEGFAIAANGQSTLGPFDGDLLLTFPEEQPATIAVRRMDVWQTSVSGEFVLLDDGVSGRLDLSGGGVRGDIVLRPEEGGQGFDVDLNVREASFAGETPITVRRAQTQFSGVLSAGHSNVQGALRAQGINYGTLFFGRVAARAELTDGTGDFTVSAVGSRGSGLSLQAQGDIAPDRLALAARGEFGGERISMPRRAVLEKQEDGAWYLHPVQLTYGSGHAIAQGTFGGTSDPSGSFKFSEMPLSLLDIALGEVGIGGTISGVVELQAHRNAPPTGRAGIMLNQITRSGLTLSSRPLDIGLVADLSAEKLETRAVIEEDGERRGRLQARIANLQASGGLVDRLYDGDLFAQLRFTGAADSLWRLTGVEVFDLTGPVAVAADATGTLSDPRVNGTVSSDSLRLRSGVTGTDIRDVKAKGSFSGSLLRLTSVSGTASNGGSVTGSGTVDIAGLGKTLPKIDMRLAARNATLVDRSEMGATVTGPLRIVTHGNNGTIAGRFTIVSARWRLGTTEEVAALPDIPIEEINLPPDIAPTVRQAQPWRYLIDARGQDGIKVTGLGLESEWGATVRIRGTTADPRVGGVASLRDGEYRFAGTSFELTRGRILFDENAPPDPELDVLAESSVDGFTARVAVTGSGLQPEIQLSSVPGLPEDEILARLLFGGSFQSLSATDAVQLGAALAAFRGGGGMDPINQLRSAIGLDRLRIVAPDPALNRGTSIAVGKNITRRFYAELITDGAGYSATRLEFRITSWLSLLASVSTIGRESVSIEARKDY